MQFLTRWTTIICLTLTISVICPKSSIAIEDAIIAVVNDELITLKDLKDYVQATYVSLVAEGMDDDRIQAIMKDMEVNGTNKLIEDKLILSKANIIGMEIREGLIDTRIEEIETSYGSEQNLVNALVKNGATLTDLRNKIRDQLKIKFVVDREVRAEIYVNPQEVTNYYEQNKNQFLEKDRLNVESIFIAYGNDKKAALAKTIEVFKSVAANNDFNNLIEKYSDGPSVGIVKRGQLLPHIEEIIFNLKLNQTSPLVEVADNGIYIFKLVGKIPAQIANLENVKESIYELLYKKKFKDEFMRWLENLKKEAYIEIKQ